MGKALDLALGGHTHLVQRIDQAEPLIERVAGQLATEPAIILLQQGPQDRAPQGPSGTLLKLLLLQRGGFPRPRTRPACQSTLDKVPLRSAVAQKSIDLFQALAQGEVVNVPDNGGQLGAKLLGERNNLAGHEASL